MRLCRNYLLRRPFSGLGGLGVRPLSSTVLASYHPAVVRIYNSYEHSNSSTDLFSLHFKVKYFVNLWSKNAHKNTKWRNFMSLDDKERLNKSCRACLQLMQSVSSDAELDLLCSLMTVLSSNSETAWIEFDRIMSKRLQSCGQQTAVLASVTLLNASALLRYKDTSFAFPRAVGKMILERKWSGIQSTSSSSIYSEIERLGLMLQLLAHTIPRKPIPPSVEEFEFLAELVTSATALMESAATYEIPFSTWKYIWTYAPLIDMPEAKEFYRLLYERVMESVDRNPLQLLYQEEAIVSLFDSMIKSKLKHTDLINKISEELLHRGMDYPRVGLKMFSALLELGAVRLASSVLNNLMNPPAGFSDTTRLEMTLNEGLRGGSFKLTNTASDRVYHLLKNNDAATPTTRIKAAPLTPFEASQLARQKTAPKQYRSSDLILALLCFNRKERNSDHLHLLESIELDLISRGTMPTLPITDVVNIFNVYGVLGRTYPTMLRQLDSALETQTSVFTLYHWPTILWSCARLNHCPAYIDTVIADYFKFVSALRVLTHTDMHLLTKSLWSMAVLRKLEWSHIEQVYSLLQAYVRKGDRGWEVDPSGCVQLAQVQVELNIKPAMEGISDDIVKKLNDFLSTIAVKERVHRRLTNAAVSSYTHMEASRIMDELGIGHEMEKMLSLGYIADIFVPPSKARLGSLNSVGVPFLGTAVELDGPYHYDTYMRMPLGSGVMKIRHLTALGYEVVSLPYWEYKASMTTHQKKNVLIKATGNI